MFLKLDDKRLAINGGEPLRNKKWLDNFTIGTEEKDAVIRSMDSGYLSLFEGSHTPDPPFSFEGGPEVIALEQEWSDYYNVNYSVAVNSATSGLFAAIGALEIGYGDEVIVSPYTMTACAIAPLLYGAIPVFADIDINTGCLDPNSIKEKVTKNTKAILVVHQFGIPADMNEIKAIADKHNLKIIEDCAQAHGATYNGQNVGTIGDIGVFSLNVNKTIQAGEGGICTTNSNELKYRLQLIRNHGEAVVEKAEYKNITNILGFNYRMTEYSAAIAREQLKKLEALNNKRLFYVDMIKDFFKSNELFKVLSNNNSDNKNSKETYYVLPLRFNSDKCNLTRNEVVKALNAEGLILFQGYVKPLYLQPVYQQKKLFKHGYPFSAYENKKLQQNYKKGICPNAEKLHYEDLIISEHVRAPNTEKDIKDFIDVFEKILN